MNNNYHRIKTLSKHFKVKIKMRKDNKLKMKLSSETLLMTIKKKVKLKNVNKYINKINKINTQDYNNSLIKIKDFNCRYVKRI
jgi:hypothetical protein